MVMNYVPVLNSSLIVSLSESIESEGVENGELSASLLAQHASVPNGLDRTRIPPYFSHCRFNTFISTSFPLSLHRYYYFFLSLALQVRLGYCL